MLERIHIAWEQLIRFLRKPEDLATPHLTQRQKTHILISFLLLGLVASFILIIFVSIVEELLDLPPLEHGIIELIEKHPVFTFIFAVIFGPFLEELIFRSWITFRRAYPLFWLIVLIKFLTGNSQYKLLKITKQVWAKSYGVIFYASALIFSLIHITNFNNYENLLWLAPLLTLPQFLLGLIFGYVRLKLGFIWGYALHASHNFILITPSLLFM